LFCEAPGCGVPIRLPNGVVPFWLFNFAIALRLDWRPLIPRHFSAWWAKRVMRRERLQFGHVCHGMYDAGLPPGLSFSRPLVVPAAGDPVSWLFGVLSLSAFSCFLSSSRSFFVLA